MGKKGEEEERHAELIPPPYSSLSYIKVLRGHRAKPLLPNARLGVLSLTGSCLVAFKHCHS